MTARYRSIPPITDERDVYPQPITALAFDPISDTLWAGLNSGNVVAYYTSQGMRGVSFPVGGGLAVKKLTATESGVRAFGLSSEGIGAWGKGGVNKWYYRSVRLPVLLYITYSWRLRSPAQVTTASNNASPSSMFAISTSAPELLVMNSQTGDVLRRSQAPSILTHLLWSGTYLLSGSSDGCL